MSLKPADTMILFADIQESVVAHAKTNEPAAIRRAAAALAGFARDLSIPAFASVVPFGDGEPRPVDEITAALPALPVLVRHGPQVMAHAPSRAALLGAGRKRAAIAGIASEVVVLHASLDLLAAGIELHVLLDASGGFSARTEQAALRRIEAAGGILSSVASFTTGFAEDFGTPEGKAAMAALVAIMG